MIKRFTVFLILLGLGAIFLQMLMQYVPDTGLNWSARYYAENAANEVGAANVVTAIIVTYRGLDTLGEVTVLFLTAAIVGLVLSQDEKRATRPAAERPGPGELLITGSRLLVPLILLFGAYIFINGHLTPGGGFQGGAILASATLLLLLTRPVKHFSHVAITRLESVSGLVFVVVGLFGLALAGGFLDNRILPTGTLGELFSAGTIPIIYSFIGLKVGAEFSSMLLKLAETEDS
jgi:multicomponent Na+:H+ antiporter subunit B